MSPVAEFQVRAALWVVRAIGSSTVETTSLEGVFHRAVTQGRFPRPDLDNGFRLLRDRQLLLVGDGRVVRHESLDALLQLADEAALPLLALLLTDGDDQSDEADLVRELRGEAGEIAVAAWCAQELMALGRPELAAQVQRVSLVSDRFGFDVSAPTTDSAPRQLEVKTTGSMVTKVFRFFLTRNEYEVGRRNPRTWALVACQELDEIVSIVGWCRASELERYLPDDASGRWTEALVHLPIRALFPHAPSAVN
jgi:hypothetical protein